jgi:hypothetical protein
MCYATMLMICMHYVLCNYVNDLYDYAMDLYDHVYV